MKKGVHAEQENVFVTGIHQIFQIQGDLNSHFLQGLEHFQLVASEVLLRHTLLLQRQNLLQFVTFYVVFQHVRNHVSRTQVSFQILNSHNSNILRMRVHFQPPKNQYFIFRVQVRWLQIVLRKRLIQFLTRVQFYLFQIYSLQIKNLFINTESNFYFYYLKNELHPTIILNISESIHRDFGRIGIQ